MFQSKVSDECLFLDSILPVGQIASIRSRADPKAGRYHSFPSFSHGCTVQPQDYYTLSQDLPLKGIGLTAKSPVGRRCEKKKIYSVTCILQKKDALGV